MAVRIRSNERITPKPWEEMEVQVGDCVAMDFIIHLHRPDQFIERFGNGHRFRPEGQHLVRRKLERLNHVPFRDNACITGQRGSRLRRHPNCRKFSDHTQWATMAADGAGRLCTLRRSHGQTIAVWLGFQTDPLP